MGGGGEEKYLYERTSRARSPSPLSPGSRARVRGGGGGVDALSCCLSFML